MGFFLSLGQLSFFGGRIERRRLDDELKHSACGFVEACFGEFATSNSAADAADIGVGAGHEEVDAGGYFLCGILVLGPIGEDYAIESELIAEDVREEMFVLLHGRSVDAVVRGHDCPRLGIGDGAAEVLEVGCAHGLLVDDDVVVEAIGFLIVEGIVFGCSSDSCGLNTSDHGGGHFAAEFRIFGVVLEIASAERVSHEVHSGREEYIYAECACFFAKGFAHFFEKFGVA